MGGGPPGIFDAPTHALLVLQISPHLHYATVLQNADALRGYLFAKHPAFPAICSLTHVRTYLQYFGKNWLPKMHVDHLIATFPVTAKSHPAAESNLKALQQAALLLGPSASGSGLSDTWGVVIDQLDYSHPLLAVLNLQTTGCRHVQTFHSQREVPSAC